MKKLYLSLTLCASLLMSSLSASAKPAKAGLIPMTQPDGTTINVRLVGDESFHYYLSEDGYLLANHNNTFYYATVDGIGTTIRSDIRATAPAQRTAAAKKYLSTVSMPEVFKAMDARAQAAPKRIAPMRRLPGTSPLKAPQGPGLFSDADYPVIGNPKAIVILVEYKDVKMTLNNAHEYFDNMLNQTGFSEYAGTGSAKDFFIECSDSLFMPDFDLYGPVTLPQNRSYYGGNDWSGNDNRPEQMIIHACQALDDEVDFSQYDTNGDGYIDNVFVFYAGRGEADGGSDDTVWPHSWNISAATSTPYYFDGVRLDRYACSNEYGSGRPDGVGTFVHEFSHVMGLPDLYATSYTNAFTPGAWSALDYGPYNNDGCTPPLYGAFERYALGWTEPLEVSGPTNATLHPIGTNQCGIIKTSKDSEFFLLENRQQTSWDTYIPGHGMLIWHIDYNASIWRSNTVNNTASHQYVDIEEADGTQSEYSRAGDVFPGTSKVRSFTGTTTPAMKTWSGTALNYPLTEITETAEGNITFKICGGREEAMPTTTVLEATEVSSDGFTANWASAGDDASYILSVYSYPDQSPAALGAESSKVYLPGYKSLNVGKVTSYPVVGTEADREYFYVVSVGNGWEESEPSEPISVITGRLPISRLAVIAEEASAISHNCFTANWQPLDDADSYILNVYTKEFGAPMIDLCDFSDGTSKLPEGWTSTTGASYANTAYSGAAVPALRLSTASDILTTPEYAEGIRSFSFWHRGNGTSEGDLVVIDALTGGKWTTLAEIPVVTEKGGATTEYAEDAIPAGTTQIRISYKRTGTKGALAIDDVAVGHSSTFSIVPIETFTDLNVGRTTTYEVTGLNPATDYFYTVHAADADGLMSKKSQEITVSTATDPNSLGVSDAATATVTVVAEGRTVKVLGADDAAVLNVYDLTGRLIGSAPASQGVALEQAGVYIVALPYSNYTTKVIVK